MRPFKNGQLVKRTHQGKLLNSIWKEVRNKIFMVIECNNGYRFDLLNPKKDSKWKFKCSLCDFNHSSKLFETYIEPSKQSILEHKNMIYFKNNLKEII